MDKQIIQPVKLQDQQWEELRPILLQELGASGPPAGDNRLFIDAVLYILYTNPAWSKLPSTFGNFNTLYVRFRRWHASGLWHCLADKKVQDESLRVFLNRIAEHGDLIEKKIRRREESKKLAYIEKWIGS